MMPRWVRRAIPMDRQFQFKVYQRGDCWEWRGARRKGGYGCLAPFTESVYAHRVAYEMAKGPLGTNNSRYVIDHICRHKWCVRPSHLEVVRQRTNVLRGDHPVARARRLDHCKYGHPYTTENTYRRPDTGGRQCLICKRIYKAAFDSQVRDSLRVRTTLGSF
jgi:hypothetical protein